MGTKPPKTKRFCVACERITLWAYNRNVGHSQCCTCGGQYGTDPDSYFTTVYKQKAKAEKRLNKVEHNYVKLLELFLKEEHSFSKRIRRKVRSLYDPSVKVEEEENELQSKQEEEGNCCGDRKTEGDDDVSRIY